MQLTVERRIIQPLRENGGCQSLLSQIMVEAPWGVHGAPLILLPAILLASQVFKLVSNSITFMRYHTRTRLFIEIKLRVSSRFWCLAFQPYRAFSSRAARDSSRRYSCLKVLLSYQRRVSFVCTKIDSVAIYASILQSLRSFESSIYV